MNSLPLKTSPRANGRRGFTLTEILVAIGIIAFLAALMMPAVKTMQKKAGATHCLSNLRQTYSLLMDDVQQSGELPKAWDEIAQTAWINVKYDNLKAANDSSYKVLGCPVQRRALRLPSDARTYSMNSVIVNTYWNPPPGRLPKYRDPSKIALLTDGGVRSSAPNSYNSGVTMDNLPQCIHDGKANIAFMDGHIAALLEKDIPKGTKPVGTPESIFWLGR